MIRKAVNDLMSSLAIPYMFWEYEADEIPGCYFVGEEMEDPATQEDGCVSGTFVLSGWSRKGLPILHDHQSLVKRRLKEPLHVRTDEGAVVIEYSHSTGVPSDVEGVCRLEINLKYHEWSVN